MRLYAISKKNGKKARFFLERMKPVTENDLNYYFVFDETGIVNLEWRLAK